MGKYRFLNIFFMEKSFKKNQKAKDISKEWMYDYNYNRPHQSLKNKTPIEYRLNE